MPIYRIPSAMTVPRQQISSMVRRLVTFPKGVSHYATHIAPRRWSIYAKVSLVVAVGGGVWAVSDYKGKSASDLGCVY